MAKTVCFEGPHGCGKTQQARIFADLLRETDSPVEYFAEASYHGSVHGGELGRWIGGAGKEHSHPDFYTLIYSAIRVEGLHSTILPFLEKHPDGILVLERGPASTFALQSADGASLELIRELNRLTLPPGFPEYYILLDLPPQESMTRIKIAHEGESLPELESWRDFQFEKFEKIRANYLALATGREEAIGGKWLVIDATRHPLEIAQEAWGRIWPYLLQDEEIRKTAEGQVPPFEETWQKANRESEGLFASTLERHRREWRIVPETADLICDRYVEAREGMGLVPIEEVRAKTLRTWQSYGIMEEPEGKISKKRER